MCPGVDKNTKYGIGYTTEMRYQNATISRFHWWERDRELRKYSVHINEREREDFKIAAFNAELSAIFVDELAEQLKNEREEVAF